MIEHLIGDGARDFRRGATWPDRAALYRSGSDWFRTIAALPIFTDPEEWLDRAPELRSFKTPGLLSRSDAKRRYQEGESVYLLGLDRADRQLRDWCDRLAIDLAVTPGSVSVQAWAAGTATQVAMHYDHDFNFNLQLVGCKQWQTAQNDLVANPVRSYHTARASGVATDSGRDMPTGMPQDAQTWTAEPGDLVWLPQGTWHATRTEEPSVAMAFVIRPLTWGDHVANALRDRLHEDRRWRERVLNARDLTRHRQLRKRGRDALAASRDALASIGPSELLYQSLWNQHPPAFKRRDDISEPVLNRSTGVLTWCQAGKSRECPIPAWAHAVCERIIDTRAAWSIATLHDAVDSDDVPFLNLLVSQLKEAGFLEQVPAASGGVATR
jgi:hypothetical protein